MFTFLCPTTSWPLSPAPSFKRSQCPQLPWDDEPRVIETGSDPAWGVGEEMVPSLRDPRVSLEAVKWYPGGFGGRSWLPSCPHFLLGPVPATAISAQSLHLVHIQHGVSLCVILFVFISVIPLLFAQLLSDCCLKVSRDNCRTPA